MSHKEDAKFDGDKCSSDEWNSIFTDRIEFAEFAEEHEHVHESIKAFLRKYELELYLIG